MSSDMESSSAIVARSRLAILAAHLSAAATFEPPEMASSLVAHCVSARTTVPPPEMLKGSLTVVDERTGKRYQIQISEDGTIKANDLKKITTGPNDKGLKLYDPGYLNTAPVRSSISYIDGDEGILRYRGYPIEELAESSTFVEVAYLLMYGNLPSQSQLEDWEFTISQHSAVPQGLLDIIQSMPHDAHPMGVLVSAMSALSIFHPDANPALRGQDLYKSKQVRDKQIARVIGKAPTIAAAAYLRLAGRPPVLPSSNLSYSENFLYMLDSLGNTSYKPNPRLARVIDILFILHAEHEMNCSTSAARHLASSGVDVFTALSGAVGALYGPLHGGANEAVLKMLSEIGTVENIPGFIEGVKNRKRKMSGFGHRVYKNYDPRAKVIRKLAEEVFSIVGRDPLIEVAVALEKTALSDEYFVKRKLYPNVDFYSGLIYRAMGFPPEFFTVLFAIPRMAGYLAHWRESLDDPDTKIIRPQQVSSLLTDPGNRDICPNLAKSRLRKLKIGLRSRSDFLRIMQTISSVNLILGAFMKLRSTPGNGCFIIFHPKNVSYQPKQTGSVRFRFRTPPSADCLDQGSRLFGENKTMQDCKENKTCWLVQALPESDEQCWIVEC